MGYLDAARFVELLNVNSPFKLLRQWRNYIEANEATASVEIRLVGAWLDVA